MTDKKWIGYTKRYLVKVVKCINFQKELDAGGSPGPRSLVPGSTVYTDPLGVDSAMVSCIAYNCKCGLCVLVQLTGKGVFCDVGGALLVALMPVERVFVLQKLSEAGQWHLIQAGSCFDACKSSAGQ